MWNASQQAIDATTLVLLLAIDTENDSSTGKLFAPPAP
jgi:hypothetical protein